MINRLVKWFSFSVGFMILPIIFSIIAHKILTLPVDLNSYSNELIFMAITISATSIGDIFALIEKGAKGIKTTVLLILLLFMALICVLAYAVIDVAGLTGLTIDTSLVMKLTVVAVISSLIIGIVCQVFLAKVEGD